jgi:hypothetical protein
MCMLGYFRGEVKLRHPQLLLGGGVGLLYG